MKVVLVVDDKRDIGKNLRDLLEAEGYRVDVAFDGARRDPQNPRGLFGRPPICDRFKNLKLPVG